MIFDSNAEIGTGEGVYMTAIGEELTGAELESGIDAFASWSEAHGGSPWTVDDVRPPARHRLYRACVSQHWLLGSKDRRIPVTL